jgi:hypothetical protein
MQDIGSPSGQTDPSLKMQHDREITFKAKTWIVTAQVLVTGFLSGFSLILGPLFYFEVVKDARGEAAPDAGLGSMIAGAILLPFFFLFTFNRLALRHPVLCIRREGLVIYWHGGSSLDNVAGVPGILRVAWLIVSGQGFRMQTLHVPWRSLKDVKVGGIPMARRLTILGAMFDPDDDSSPVADQFTFHEASIRKSPGHISDSIREFYHDASLRDCLAGESAIGFAQQIFAQ